MRAVLVCACLAFACSPALAQEDSFQTVGDLSRMCKVLERLTDGARDLTDAELGDGYYCMGFFHADGVDQALRNRQGTYCAPDGIPIAQRTMIFLSWAQKHPEKLHYPDLVGARIALKEAFPCD